MKRYLLSIILALVVAPVWGAAYYISPTGSDSNPGTSTSTPIATFVHAQTLLTPGDTLILMDGTYNQQLSPRISGTDGNPITFQAQNRGQAVIQMTSSAPHIALGGEAILLFSTSSGYSGGPFYCHDITIDGLIARGYGEYLTISVGSWDTATEPEMTKRIIIKNTGAFGSANLTNNTVWGVGNNATHILLEGIFGYGIGRKSISIFGARYVTVRRAVFRYDWWDGRMDGGKPHDPRSTFSGYNTEDSIFENIVVLDGAPPPAHTMPPFYEEGPDMALFVASGNLTPAYVTHSSRNKYLGLLGLNSYGNGVLTNGGGSANEDQHFKDIILHKTIGGGGVFIEQLDTRGTYEYITTWGTTFSGFTAVSSTLSNEIIRNNFVTDSSFYGYIYNQTAVDTFENNTAINSVEGGNIEANYAPTMNYLTRPTMVAGHPRGGTMVYRYVDGVLTADLLWPWPNEALIKQHMCNADDLATAHRVAANGPGWEPEWCASGKTLTQHIWEYLGSPTPTEITGASTSGRRYSIIRVD